MKLLIWLIFAGVLWLLWINVPKGSEAAYLVLLPAWLLWFATGVVYFFSWVAASAARRAFRRAGPRAVKKGDQDAA